MLLGQCQYSRPLRLLLLVPLSPVVQLLMGLPWFLFGGGGDDDEDDDEFVVDDDSEIEVDLADFGATSDG